MCIIFCSSSWSRSYHQASCYSFSGSCRLKLKFDKRSMIITWAVRKVHWIANQSCVGAFEAYFCVAMSLTSLGRCIWSFLVGCIKHMEGIWSYHRCTKTFLVTTMVEMHTPVLVEDSIGWWKRVMMVLIKLLEMRMTKWHPLFLSISHPNRENEAGTFNYEFSFESSLVK